MQETAARHLRTITLFFHHYIMPFASIGGLSMEFSSFNVPCLLIILFLTLLQFESAL